VIVELSEREKQTLSVKVHRWANGPRVNQDMLYNDLIHELIEGIDYSTVVLPDAPKVYTLYDEFGHILVSTHNEPDRDEICRITEGGDAYPHIVQVEEG